MKIKRTKDLKALVVDDHFLIQRFVYNALKEVNVGDIQTATNGDDAIDVLQRAWEQKQPFDIVFLDWHMPKKSGLEVLTLLRSQLEFSGTAVVMLTAESEQQKVLQAIKGGAVSYILKPVAPGDLTKKIYDVFRWISDTRKIQIVSV